MIITSLVIILSIIQLFVLTLFIVRIRRSKKIALGSADNSDLERKRAAHSNFTAYMPFFLICLAIAELNQIPDWALISASAIFVIARILHSYGLIFAEPQKNNYYYRMYGMYFSFGALIVLSVTSFLFLYR